MKTGTEVPLPASLPPDGAPFGPTHFDANVPPMLDLYREADIETQWINPSDLNVSSVGHLSFFHSDVGQPLWDEVLDWLNRQT